MAELLVDAEPWLLLLLEKPFTCRLARDGCVDSLATFAVEIDIGDRFSKGHFGGTQRTPVGFSTERLREVREAMDLLYMQLILDPTVIWSQSNGLGKYLLSNSTLAAQVIERGGAFQLEVTLVAHQINNTALLHPRLYEFFMKELDVEPATSKPFVKIRDAYVKKLHSLQPRWKERLNSYPITVRYSLMTMNDLDRKWYQMEDYLVLLVQFIATVATAQATQGPDRDTSEVTRHLPLVVDRVILSISTMPITYRIVQVVKRLVNIRKRFVECQLVSVDPQMVLCSHDQVTEFLNAFDTQKELDVRTGPYLADAIDHEGMDRIDLFDSVIRGIAAYPRPMQVEIAGMLELCKTSVSRRGIYRSIIEHFFSSSTPISIALDTTTVGESDGVQLREEIAMWRTKNPNGKLRVKRFNIHITGADDPFVTAIVEGLDEIEELDLFNYRRGPGFRHHTIVPTILTKFKTMRKLRVDYAEITSMDIFLVLYPANLQSLELSCVRLADRESFSRFVKTLGDSRTLISRSLRRLHWDGGNASTGASRNDLRRS